MTGRGEKVAEKILNCVYPGCYVIPQVPVLFLKNKYSPNYEIDLSIENLKRTVDLYVVSGEYNVQDIKMVVRIQDKGTHGGSASGKNEGKSKIDAVQKRMLEDFGLTVVDILEIEHKELFANKLNPKSTAELCNTLVRELN